MKNRNIFLIIGFIILFVFGIYLLAKPTINNKSTATLVSVIPTSFQQDSKDVKIIGSYPANNDEFITTYSPITFQFQNDISEDNKKLISILINPEFSFESEWVNSKTIKIKPQSELQTSKKYTLVVSFREVKIYNLTFTTTQYPAAEAKEQIQTQIEDDIEFSKSVYRYRQENPWSTKLPITGDGYLVMYDYTSKQFIIGLSETLSTSQRETKTVEALDAIKKIYPELTDKDYYVYKEE